MTAGIDNSEWVMQGVVRDPITGALLRVNADGSLNVSVSPGGGAAGTGFTSTTTAGTAIVGTLNSSGLSVGVPNFLTAVTNAIGLNTAGTNITWTANSSGLSINAAGYAGTTTAITGNASITLNSLGLQFNGSGLAGTTTAVTGGIAATLNSAGLNLTVGAYITTADLSQNSSLYMQSASLVGANTAGTTTFSGTRLNLSGGQGITLSGNVSTIVFSVGSYITTGRASTDALGLNTAGTNITWTANSSGVSINNSGLAGTATAITGNASITLNSAGLSFNGSGLAGTNTAATNASITVNSSGVSINVPQATISSFQAFQLLNSAQVVAMNGASQSHAQAFLLPQPGSFSFVRIPVTMTTNSTAYGTTGASLSASAALFSTWNAVVYSVGTGASSTLLTAVASGSCQWTIINSISVAANGSQASYSQTISGLAAGAVTSLTSQYSSSDNVNYVFVTTLIHTIFSGNRFIDINFASSLAAGAYWAVVGYSSSSATNSTGISNATNCNVNFSANYVGSGMAQGVRVMGSTNGVQGFYGAGSFSTAGGGTTANFPLSAISSSAGNPNLYFQMLRSA